jgi:hypothetical protein
MNMRGTRVRETQSSNNGMRCWHYYWQKRSWDWIVEYYGAVVHRMEYGMEYKSE